MNPIPEADWPDEFTREEMLEQQSLLLIEECRALQEEVSRHRKNLAQLIDINSEVTAERDKLRKQKAELDQHLEDLRLESHQRSDRIASLQLILAQREAVMRQYKVPEVYFGSPHPIGQP
jgi:regulator of replication initiation timing